MTTLVPKQRVPELDGLRGVAVSLVVVFHYARRPARAGHFSRAAAAFCHHGLDRSRSFFVLSGFLIGGILMNVRESRSFLKTFYARRFFRIVPIYYLWIVFYILLVWSAGSYITRPLQFRNSAAARPRHFFLFSVFAEFCAVTLFGLAGAWFGHLWSLAVEEQFYLVAPVVVRAVAERLSEMVSWPGNCLCAASAPLYAVGASYAQLQRQYVW